MALLLSYIHYTVNDAILPKFQQHMLQRWTTFRQCILDDLIEYWRRPIEALYFYFCTLNTYCNVGYFWTVSGRWIL